MMDLVHSHSYTKLYDNQKKKVWDQKVGMNVSDRVGKRVGVLGYGSIGRQGTSIKLFLSLRIESRYRRVEDDQTLVDILNRGASICTLGVT
jgi:lactate dehydrogenase-like 2-hydroxyacid dehydrogenase